MISATFVKKTLKFKKAAGTSRGTLFEKPSWYIVLKDSANPNKQGIGECSIIPGLSIDNLKEIERCLTNVCTKISKGGEIKYPELAHFPAVAFGLETALQDLNCGAKQILYESEFTKGNEGILINGLIWMGSIDYILQQIEKKISEGFHCLKMKIGALGFKQELQVLKDLRTVYPASQLELRVDANGAFKAIEAPEILEKLAPLQIHSIEQPIAAGQWKEMTDLCRNSPVPIALDEELIPILKKEAREGLLQEIKPQYIILKPSLLGGVKQSEEWIALAEEQNIGYWLTSALESNIGLNAIAQWAYRLKPSMPQGLGTGALFVNNIVSPLYLKGEKLFYDSRKEWNFEFVS